MRTYDEEDLEYIEELNAQDWQIELLKLNPRYNSWGNREDYMYTAKDDWSSPVEIDSADGLWAQNDLNVVANFYFEVFRPSKPCERCNESGYNAETLKISDEWYAFGNSYRIPNPYKRHATYNVNAHCHNITQAEVDALWDAGRLGFDFDSKPTPQEVNEWNLKTPSGHDGINRGICVEARAKDLGVWGFCQECSGKGYVYTSDRATVSLQLWVLHPRKGSSRGLYLKDIKEEEVPQVISYLREAGDKMAERFAKLPSLEGV